MSSARKIRIKIKACIVVPLAIFSVFNLCFSFPANGQEFNKPDLIQSANIASQDEFDGKQPDVVSAQPLDVEQKLLAEKYQLLEEKLFSLHEYEKDGNPTRAKLLERAFLQSQSNMTAAQMKQVVELLTDSKLKDAEKEQKLVLSELTDLLNLLQSEDRGKRVQDEIRRHQEYLKEVERILRIQKGIRGQAEGGVDGRRLANSENKTADRTGSLAEEIRQNEEGRDEESDAAETELLPDRADDSANPADQTNPDDDSNGPPQTEAAGPPGDRDPKQPGVSPDSDDNSKGIEQPSQPQADGQSGSAQKNPGGESSDSREPGERGNPQSSDSMPKTDENPTRSKIQAAEQRMRDAQQKLESARRDEAIEAMKQAEREMALAKKELEEILRQLREEEVERTLAMLESRFRQMLEREIRVHDATRKLDEIAIQRRGTEFEIRSGKLGIEQNSIATEAARALLLLQEDGSSVAFPVTVDEMHQDMLQVASRLSAAKVGRISIEIEEDIIDTLEYLVEALVQTQQDSEQVKQQNQQSKQGQTGDKPLVDQLAEIKMLRGLQERIFRRHRRYSQFLDDPEDPVGRTEDPELQSALQRLADKQAKLTEIARDIVNEKNK